MVVKELPLPQEYEFLLSSDGESFMWVPIPTIEPPQQSKCPSCGSHQFVMHANRRICSYCRSEG